MGTAPSEGEESRVGSVIVYVAVVDESHD